MPDKTDALKESYRDTACIILQDSIKYKRNDINRYNGLYNTLEQAGIVPLDYDVANVTEEMGYGFYEDKLIDKENYKKSKNKIGELIEKFKKDCSCSKKS